MPLPLPIPLPPPEIIKLPIQTVTPPQAIKPISVIYQLKKLVNYEGKTPEREDDEDQHFDVTYKIALLIANSHYDQVRAAGKTTYTDIEQSLGDIEVMSKLCHDLNFDQIIESVNESRK